MSRTWVAVLLLACAVGAWAWRLAPGLAPWPAASSRAPSPAAAIVVPAVRLPQLTSRPVAGAPSEASRNPFMDVGASRSASTGPAGPPATPQAPAPTRPPAPEWPRLDLIGVAEARDGAAIVRTAVIAGPRGVQHARPGDLIEMVYRLERVTATGADLRLLPEDRLVHLALRP